jgi:hypothetical protein
MATWFDIKFRTMNKIYASKGNDIPNDSSSVDYIAAMPGACNEALQLLATAGKFIIKSIQIAHNPVKNLIADGKRILSSEGGTLTIQATNAKSLYAEVLGNVTMTISVDGFVVSSESISSKSHYSPVRRLITNPDNKNVEVSFTSDYPLAIKNYALYGATFESADDVQSFAEVCKYDLKQMADSFYMLSQDGVIFEGSQGISRYELTSDYYEEGGSILVLDRDKPGNYTIYYRAYPQTITASTPDDYVLELDPEVDALVPLYMASQLYKEDDNALATTYRNEFEAGFERLKDAKKETSSEKFSSESGWI